MGDYSAWTDAQLVIGVRHGDARAFGELYSRHVRATTVAVAARLRNHAAIADAVQDAFVVALERLDSLREPERFRPWLLAIARNEAVSTIRDQAKAVPDGDAGAASIDEAPGPEQLVELGELAALVQGCVGGLSERDATTITMVSQFGFSPAEVGTALGLSANAAKVVIHRARRRMRDALVLELMVRRRRGGCDDLEVLLLAKDVVAASAHVITCAQCHDAALADVLAYDVRPMDPPGGGNEEVAARVLGKLRQFAADSLAADERLALAAILGPGTRQAFEAFGDDTKWSSDALARAMARV